MSKIRDFYRKFLSAKDINSVRDERMVKRDEYKDCEVQSNATL